MSKKIFILSLLIGLIGGGVFLFIIEKPQWLLSWVCGIFMGIFPFVFWQITRNVLYKSTKCSKDDKIEENQTNRLSFRYYLLLAILVFKFIMLGILIILIGNLKFIIGTPFLIGFIIMVPIIITLLIVYQREQNSRENNKSILMFYGK
ncbi:MAG: hypothetical protein V1871_08915 [Planctomycetota bacterium]